MIIRLHVIIRSPFPLNEHTVLKYEYMYLHTLITTALSTFHIIIIIKSPSQSMGSIPNAELDEVSY